MGLGIAVFHLIWPVCTSTAAIKPVDFPTIWREPPRSTAPRLCRAVWLLGPSFTMTHEFIPAWYTRSVSGLRSEEHTSELQSHLNLVCRLLLEKKNKLL